MSIGLMLKKETDRSLVSQGIGEITQDLSFIFREGCPMTTEQREEFAAKHCNYCEDYRERARIANALNEIFGSVGRWNFDVCYKTCIQKDLIEQKRAAERRHAWYLQYKAKAVAR